MHSVASPPSKLEKADPDPSSPSDPSMASTLLLRASRDLARAARIVASRCARSGRSAPGGGPVRPRRGRLPSSFRCGGDTDTPLSAPVVGHPPTTQQRQGSGGLGSPSACRTPPLSNSNMAASPAGADVEFVVEDKDVESDRAIWALYKRWCVAFNQRRGREEMLHRFGTFKEDVLFVVSQNKSGSQGKLMINAFADGKLLEHCQFSLPIEPRHAPAFIHPNSVAYVSPDGLVECLFAGDVEIEPDQSPVQIP